MKASNIQSITYMKTHSADLVKAVNESRSPVVITQNGRARAVVMDAASYEQMKDALILLKILAQSDGEYWKGRNRRRMWKPTSRRSSRVEAPASALDDSRVCLKSWDS